MPLLELAQIAVETSLRVQMRHFLESGLIPERQQRPEYQGRRRRDHPSAKRAVGGRGASSFWRFVFSLLIRDRRGSADRGFELAAPRRRDHAGRLVVHPGQPADPLLLSGLLGWLFLLWAWFLFRTSRLDLELTPTHPDRAGGLGFLGWGMASFGLVVLAVSAVLSGSLAREIIHAGSSLASVKYHVIIFVIIVMVILHAPLLVFTGRLARCRFRGLLDFGALIWAHDHEFDEKWIKKLGKKGRAKAFWAVATSLRWGRSRARSNTSTEMLLDALSTRRRRWFWCWRPSCRWSRCWGLPCRSEKS